MGGDRGVGGRLIAACYTFRVPRVISNFSVTRKKEMMVEEMKETRNIIYLSSFLILFSKVSMFDRKDQKNISLFVSSIFLLLFPNLLNLKRIS